ncbi:hypothetical protein AYI68_g2616 [Smittium mucronatum]|uniref:YCII-related domain-containing protein n=1 Tax=Smittium mucronatum TaxID=133383 RepID=A0A1R0H287_9FUNG|nr:hypothetical protein AYI68_g6321 [Smittium mucronatum]OLY83246.1 hypothetical protein AYI68_g2616 [Smittium mucronatum]
MEQKKFLVYVHDFSDKDCINRRLSAREQEINDKTVLKKQGKLKIMGGALVDESGFMSGSSLVYLAEDKEKVLELMKNDVYAKAGVWDMSTTHIFDITR